MGELKVSDGPLPTIAEFEEGVPPAYWLAMWLINSATVQELRSNLVGVSSYVSEQVFYGSFVGQRCICMSIDRLKENLAGVGGTDDWRDIVADSLGYDGSAVLKSSFSEHMEEVAQTIYAAHMPGNTPPGPAWVKVNCHISHAGTAGTLELRAG